MLTSHLFLQKKKKKKIEEEFSFVVDEDLFNTTKEGDVEKVKIALESGVSPDVRLSLEDGEETREPLLSIAARVRISLTVCPVKIRHYAKNFVITP